MTNVIKLKTGTSTPTTSDITNLEVAIDKSAAKLYLNDNGTIKEIGGGGSGNSISDGDKGDITVGSSGTSWTIDSGVIDNANIASNAAIAGTKISPDFGSQNITTTGDLTITNTNPKISLVDSDNNDDFEIKNNNGVFTIRDTTDNSNRMTIASNGQFDFDGNVDCNYGLDVTGNLAVDSDTLFVDSTNDRVGINQISPSYQLDLVGTQRNTVSAADTSLLILNANMGTSNNRAILVKAPETDSGVAPFRIQTGNAVEIQIDEQKTLNINSSGQINLHHAGSSDAKLSTSSTGVSVSGNIAVTGTVDGVDIATRDTLFGALTSSSGVLTDGVTATSQMATDSSNKVATTQFTQNAIGNATISGSQITPSFTSDITISKQNPVISLSDPDASDASYQIRNDNGTFDIKDTTNSSVRIRVTTSYCTIYPNLNANNGLDVTGNITVTGTVDGVDIAALNSTVSGKLSNIVEDTTPQLGGDLDMNSKFISSGILGIKNTGSQSELRLYCESNNAHYAALKAPAHADFSGNLTYTLPSGYGSNGQVLQSNGSGGTSWVDQTGSYNNSSVDSHLNTSSASSSQVLSWNGSDYAWVAQSGGGGGGISNVVEDTTPQLGGNLDMQSNNISGTGTITATSVASSANGMRKITASTSSPSGGSDGDVWIKYTA